jgi:solute carrier family 25 folate transporter 32
MTANLLGLSHVAIQFPLYEQLKVQLRGPHKPHESPTDLLLASSLSKMMASLVSYPHEVIRSRMMDSREVRHHQPSPQHPPLPTAVTTTTVTTTTFTGTCRSIYQAEGVRGFYAGLPISLVRVIPNTCVTFVTYELLLRWCTRQRERHRVRR